MATSSTQALLEARGLSKAYPSVIANEDVSLTIQPGEIHAVLGENGAGKSTLMKMFYGIIRPDAGEILWNGKLIQIESPAKARELGIGMVFQHFSLFETLTVAENIALALDHKVSLPQLTEDILGISKKYGLTVEPEKLVHSLSVGERQRVEIIRSLLQKPRLLIMDEPTSVLTPDAVQKLFSTLRRLAKEGCSILYISHKLDEIQALCHSATILRNGRVTGNCIPSEESPASMASMMIGHDLPVSSHQQQRHRGEVKLRLAGLSHSSENPFGVDLKDIHLEVHAGEIVGIAGVSGNGQQELMMAISGEDPIAEKYPVQIGEHQAGRLNAAQRRKLGMCFVPEERLGRGAVPPLYLTDNALLTSYHNAMLRRGLINFPRIGAFARECINTFQVKCGGEKSLANSLSGGNLQKFIVGREILQKPEVLLISQPTWGVDVGAAAFIRQQLIDLSEDGTAILVISEEIEELFEISDRIAVLAKGMLSPSIPIAETSLEEIGIWMTTGWDRGEEGKHAAVH
ncbi:MAG: ABC transporter ATP-binding protein [Gammaproteobacteria bacterium]